EASAGWPLDHEPLEAAVALPLAAADRRIGVIGLAFRDPVSFDPRRRALLLDLTRQAALALDRARLFAEAQRSRQRPQLLVDASARCAGAATSVAELLAGLAEELSRDFAQSCTIVICEPDGEARIAMFRHEDPVREAGVRQLFATHRIEPG